MANLGCKYMCGTPKDECTGSLDGKYDRDGHKLHSSIVEAKRCFVSYLLRYGWKRDSLLKNLFRKDGQPSKCT